jgi:hypothetical protein
VDVARIEVRDQIESEEGRITWMTDRAVDQLRAAGRLVSTGSDHVIPQHVAHTPSELAALLAEYESLAKILDSRRHPCARRADRCCEPSWPAADDKDVRFRNDRCEP